MKPITLFCPFSRHWAMERWLDNLHKQNYPARLINLCFIVDIDDARIMSDLQKFVELAEKSERPYRSFHVKNNCDWHPDEVHLSIRRMRIADIHNQSKALIGATDGEVVIGLEDDTVFDDPETINKLLAPLEGNVAFVQGVQIGRHGTCYVGAWRCDDPMQVNHIKTALPPEGGFEGLEDIDAGGMFGYATPRELYMLHDYHTSSGAPYAVDVNYGIWLRQRGYRCLIDWGLLFAHNAYNILLWPNDPPTPLTEVNYTRDITTSRWERRDYENSNRNRE